jgi:hypothetical protein
MRNQSQDEQLDQLMQKLMSDAALDEAAVNDIADSPSTWWGIQRRINEQKAAKSPWPPVLKRWLAITVPAMAGILLGIFYFTSRSSVTPDEVSSNVPPASTVSAPITVEEPAPSQAEKPSPVNATSRLSSIKPQPVKTIPAAKRSTAKALQPTLAKAPPSEIETDFIALTYARDPDSGQLVRVRVPSSMMVTLGLVGSVKKPAAMVDAEVLVGDDGLTRAIRFIR